MKIYKLNYALLAYEGNIKKDSFEVLLFYRAYATQYCY